MKTLIQKTKQFAKHASTMIAGTFTGLLVKASTAYAQAVPKLGDVAVDPDVMAPITKLLGLLHWLGLTIAGLALMWAFVSYMISGDDPVKRDKSKKGIGVAAIAIVGIGVAPYLINWIIV